MALARELAALPQVCLRSDRMSALEQWGLTEEEAAVNEARRGRDVIAQRRDARGAPRVRGGCRPQWRCAPRDRPSDAASRSADRPTVAAFDFDGTLTDAGSVFPWLISLRGLLPVLRRCVRLSPGLVRAALVGGVAADEVKEKVFTRLLAGLPVADVDRRSAAFARAPRATPPAPDDARRRLEWHRQQGHHVVLVSASPECYVGPAGAELSAPTAWWPPAWPSGGGGLLTGGYEGKNCRGAEKYARLVVYLRSQGLLSANGGAHPVLWAYGNSRGDLRLLNAADHGVDAGRLGSLRPPAPLSPPGRGEPPQPGVAAIPTARPE